MAQRLFLQTTADLLNVMNADDDYIIEIFKIIAETQSANDAEDILSNGMTTSPVSSIGSSSQSSPNNINGLDCEVFDKNEANVFAEPLKVISDSIVVFKSTFETRHKVVNFVNSYKVC